MQSLAFSYPNRYERKFQFGWMSDLSTINSIAMHRVKVPSVLVLNTTTVQYHLYDGPFDLTSTDATSDSESVMPLTEWLDMIAQHPDHVPLYGGDCWHHRLYRTLFDAVSTLTTMYHGQPGLTLLMFGLPISFFSIIIYFSCCSEFVDEDKIDGQSVDYDDTDGGDYEYDNEQGI